MSEENNTKPGWLSWISHEVQPGSKLAAALIESGALIKVEEGEPDTVSKYKVKTGKDEGFTIMTMEEAQNFVLEAMGQLIQDPKINKLLSLKLKVIECQQKIKEKKDDMEKLYTRFESMNRDQERFLRNEGVMTRPETQDVGVGVDLPWIPETLSNVPKESIRNLKQEKSDDVVMQSSTGKPHTSKKKEIKTELSESVEVIDLTDDDSPPVKESKSNPSTSSVAPTSSASNVTQSSTFQIKHPAPLPPVPIYLGQEVPDIPPKPQLKISVNKNGIVLLWDMPPQAKSMKITSYEIHGYQEKRKGPPSSALWKKIGTVNAVALPMSCTLTQFVENSKYHFSIRAVANGHIFGYFSEPASIMFVPDKK